MLILVSALISLANAAPFPATGSSALVSEKPGLFMSTKGFRMNAGNTAWVQSPPPKDIPSLVTVYKAPVSQHGQQPALSVRVDSLKSSQSLKKYVRRWMQDYTRFGFDVLTAKPIKINEQSAFLLDIVSKETHKQLRQVVFLRNKTAVILTCRDHKDTFSKSVQDCNQIVKSFQWDAE